MNFYAIQLARKKGGGRMKLPNPTATYLGSSISFNDDSHDIENEIVDESLIINDTIINETITTNDNDNLCDIFHKMLVLI